MGTRSTASHTFSLGISAVIQHTLANGKTAQVSFSGESLLAAFSDGVDANELDRAWESPLLYLDQDDILDLNLRDFTGQDLYAGDGNDGLGQDVIIEEIVALIIHCVSGTGKLEINPVLPSNPVTWIPLYFALNSFGGAVKPGGLRAWFESDEISLATSEGATNVRFKAIAGDVEFKVYVFGRSDIEASSSSSQSSSTSSVSSTSSGSSSTSSVSSVSSASSSSQSSSSSASSSSSLSSSSSSSSSLNSSSSSSSSLNSSSSSSSSLNSSSSSSSVV